MGVCYGYSLLLESQLLLSLRQFRIESRSAASDADDLMGDIGLKDFEADDQPADEIGECVLCGRSSLENDPGARVPEGEECPKLQMRDSGCEYCKGWWWLEKRGIVSWRDSRQCDIQSNLRWNRKLASLSHTLSS